MSSKAPGVRLSQAILLLAGAVFLVFVVAPDDGRFYWTPLTIGLAYLGAAIVGLLLRRAGFSVSPMGLAVVITGGGVALALTTQAPGLLDDARTYAVLIVAVAIANVVLALAPGLQRPHQGPRPVHHHHDPPVDRKVTYD